ncbi:FAS1-like dehydratase domain-containing protein [Aquabacter sp. P-9]|uniref:FAS1-like dehydratase domain-containing protein n=1 Tax=Aquabacter sediminis TaxID=3029197 RepID=UPI00237E811F|nr:MaoC family dehydratase N-terminal domain-containing protein [Aquabacter sp. P-9]MDE1567487.1 MaoC family dehydratase N-terminal domain-containing protein [Aquabacter sp. P-9]
MSQGLDIELLRGWIGRTDTASDEVTPQKAREMRVTLDQDPGTPQAGDAAILTAHWCLAQPTVPLRAVGPDGHPARGGFLPPVPLPRRMWAGGELQFLDAVRVGDEVTRTSRIADVVVKEGRTGILCFVTVNHEISTPRGLAVRERQDIVYRGVDAPAGGQGKAEPPRAATWQESVDAGPVMLFRYSAITFNSHRIHYDRTYCEVEEGYPGLVVHGPLQATLLVEFAARLLGRPPQVFSFRSVRPIFDGAPLTLNAVEGADGLELWTADAEGRAAMLAQAR